MLDQTADGSFTAMQERAKKSLLAGFIWRFLFSFGGFLKVLFAGRFFAACLVHVLVTALRNAVLFRVDIGVKAGFFCGHGMFLLELRVAMIAA